MGAIISIFMAIFLWVAIWGVTIAVFVILVALVGKVTLKYNNREYVRTMPTVDRFILLTTGVLLFCVTMELIKYVTWLAWFQCPKIRLAPRCKPC